MSGKSFRSKKAAGDMKRKGDKFEPFAYVKMDNDLLNRRRKHSNLRKFEAISSAAKRGVARAQKRSSKRRRMR